MAHCKHIIMSNILIVFQVQNTSSVVTRHHRHSIMWTPCQHQAAIRFSSLVDTTIRPRLTTWMAKHHLRSASRRCIQSKASSNPSKLLRRFDEWEAKNYPRPKYLAKDVDGKVSLCNDALFGRVLENFTLHSTQVWRVGLQYKPVPQGSLVWPSIFNKAMPRMTTQPLKTSKMIRNRRMKRLKRDRRKQHIFQTMYYMQIEQSFWEDCGLSRTLVGSSKWRKSHDPVSLDWKPQKDADWCEFFVSLLSTGFFRLRTRH